MVPGLVKVRSHIAVLYCTVLYCTVLRTDGIIVQAVQGRRGSQTVNREYFYRLLFTRDNLRLVHIVCHDKQEHASRRCDAKLFYIK